MAAGAGGTSFGMVSVSAVEQKMKKVAKLVDGQFVWKTVYEPGDPEFDLLPRVHQASSIAAVAAAKIAPPPKKKKAPPKKRTPKPDVFETNLTEALVGWKAWNVQDGLLVSNVIGRYAWKPDEPMVARCAQLVKHRHPVPSIRCECGIYAADTYHHIAEFEGRDAVAGEVLGWGRYVRGERGWRAQYVYPSRFLINQDSLHLLPTLMKYHVPVFCWRPVRIHDPGDDGYEHWKNEEDWDFRTAPEPDADENY